MEREPKTFCSSAGQEDFSSTYPVTHPSFPAPGPRALEQDLLKSHFPRSLSSDSGDYGSRFEALQPHRPSPPARDCPEALLRLSVDVESLKRKGTVFLLWTP